MNRTARILSAMPPGMIGLPHGGILREPAIVPTLMSMYRPSNTTFKHQSGLGPAEPLNRIGRAFLDHPGNLQWLFLMNDDNLPPMDVIPTLWEREVDVISGLYFSRIQPFEPIFFDDVRMEGGQRMYVRHYMRYGECGYFPAEVVGDGSLLIRRHVLEKILYPWWEYGATWTDRCDHDVVFSQKVVGHGFGLYCDVDVLVGHSIGGGMVVVPHRDKDGNWSVMLDQGLGRRIMMPVASPGMKFGEEE